MGLSCQSQDGALLLGLADDCALSGEGGKDEKVVHNNSILRCSQTIVHTVETATACDIQGNVISVECGVDYRDIESPLETLLTREVHDTVGW